MKTWYQSKIIRGDQTGRKYVYPTINLEPSALPDNLKRGVYASLAELDDQVYQGALYFGPRVVKHEANDVLEIYLLDFNGEIKVDTASFTIEKFLRGVLDFPNLQDLRVQVTKDIADVRKALDEK